MGNLRPAQKSTIIKSWNTLPDTLQTFYLSKELEEISAEKRHANWNKNDWARLIHIFHCPELKYFGFLLIRASSNQKC